MIQRRLIQYYVTKEFSVAKKPQKTVAQKGKKMVDNSSNRTYN
jgi:hypothetical protein